MNQIALQLDPGEPDGFTHWLSKNQHIYNRFEVLALRMAEKNHKHYSARTIVEKLRWDTDIADTDVQFKINGNFVPGMARLWMKTHGKRYPNFFRCRDSLGRDE